MVGTPLERDNPTFQAGSARDDPGLILVFSKQKTHSGRLETQSRRAVGESGGEGEPSCDLPGNDQYFGASLTQG